MKNVLKIAGGVALGIAALAGVVYLAGKNSEKKNLFDEANEKTLLVLDDENESK